VLPQVTAFQAPALPDTMARVAGALGAESAARGLFDLAAAIGAPTALRDIGMRAEDLDEAVALVAEQLPPDNPRPIEQEDVRRIVTSAFTGRRPEEGE
jgi:maleylacetate reductase